MVSHVASSVMRLIKSVSYQVLENDDLPTAVCWECLYKVEVCFELMQEHIRGQNLFQSQMRRQQVPLHWKETEVIWIT
jgi:hypothetical protein